MFFVICEAIDERVANLARAREIATVVAISPDAPTPAAERSIEEAIRADGEALHPTRESGIVLRLDDEMQMIVLHRELHDAEVVSPSPANGALERCEERLRAEARETARRAHRDMQRVPILVHGTAAMAHLGKRAGLRPRTRLLLARPREPAPGLEGDLDGSAENAALPFHLMGRF